jgi:hypothetical protein
MNNHSAEGIVVVHVRATTRQCSTRWAARLLCLHTESLGGKRQLPPLSTRLIIPAGGSSGTKDCSHFHD